MNLASDRHLEMGMPMQASKAWPYVLALILSTMFWLLAWYGSAVQSMVGTWLRSDTFAHGFLIAPISAWMIWRRRYEIMALTPRPNFWVLLPLMMVGFIWLLAHLAAVVVVQEYCLVIMILLLAATILGNAIFKELAFPMLFLLFAVPFGEVLLPDLIEYTADFTVFALRLSGIPVFREGNFFSLPSGNWSVVEACSGLRYLIASLTLGFLYAYLTYRSLTRRLVFIALSIVVPIVANWLRAYMIVMIGHLSSMTLAVGVDHLIYGWLFFGLVMLLLFWIGSYWREDQDVPETVPTVANSERIVQPAWKAILVATIASAGVVAAPPIAAKHLEGGQYVQPVLNTPTALGGWQSSRDRLSDWTPHYFGMSTSLSQTYVNDSKGVELYIGYYRNQRQSSKLITSDNALVNSSSKAWGSIGETRRRVVFNGVELDFVESKLRGRSTKLLIWHWYWIDGQYTASPYLAKLLQAKSQLTGKGDDGAVIIVSTELDEKADASPGRLRDFVHVMLPSIAKSLQSAR
jgi:exosortase A